MQAAVEYRPPRAVVGDPRREPGVPVGTRLGVEFVVRNVSDQTIRFVSESGRQGDQAHVTNERGDAVEVKETWFSGLPIDVAWRIEPGETARLPVLAPAINQLDQPGRYGVRYTIRFNSRQQRDEAGQVVFPRPGDYDRELETGTTPLFLQAVHHEISANGEIHGRLIDAETGKPVRGTQFVMHAFQRGYHVWFGTPTAGDELRIVLERKEPAASGPEEPVP